jgi:hypothetical protein
LSSVLLILFLGAANMLEMVEVLGTMEVTGTMEEIQTMAIIITNWDLVRPTMEGRREAQSKVLSTMVGSMVEITMEGSTMVVIAMEGSTMGAITMEASTLVAITMEASTLATITMGAASVTVSVQDHSNAATWPMDINVHSLNTMVRSNISEYVKSFILLQKQPSNKLW